MSPINGLTIAVPRGALFEDTVELLAALGVDTDELRSNDRKLLFEDIGVITMRPTDVPTYVEAGAADLGVTGKDVLLEQAPQHARGDGTPGVRAARPRLRPLHDGARQQGGSRPRLRGAAPPRRHARRHEVPAHRGAPPRRDRAPGGDRRGEGLRRARAPHRARRGDRRPHRDRHDAAREQPDRARGDRRLHRAPDRQPGRPQAEGRRRSTTCSSGCGRCRCPAAPEMRLERLDAAARSSSSAVPPQRLRGCARSSPGAGAVRERVRADHRSACAPKATTRCSATRAELDTRGDAAAAAARRRRGARRRARPAPARARRRPAGGDRQRRPRAPTPEWEPTPPSISRRASA